MGRKKRERPKKLPKKMQSVRLYMDLTQDEMLEILLPEHHYGRRSYINEYEAGKREPTMPSLVRLVKYLRRELKIEIYVDHFVDDSLKLPF